MFDDPLVQEIRKHREQYAASLDYDLSRIVADLQSRQQKVKETSATLVPVSIYSKGNIFKVRVALAK